MSEQVTFDELYRLKYGNVPSREEVVAIIRSMAPEPSARGSVPPSCGGGSGSARAAPPYKPWLPEEMS